MQYPGGGAPAGQTLEPEGEELSVERGSDVDVVGMFMVVAVEYRVGTSVLLSDFVGESVEGEELSVE